MARSPRTCLSSDDHGCDIEDHLSHYLGCLDYWKRSNFFDPNNEIWKKEVKHYTDLGKSQEQAEKLSDEKRRQWEENCKKELSRIKFLRQTLGKDDEDKHLLEKIGASGQAWRASGEYKDNIEKVKCWRRGKGLSNDGPPEETSIGNQRTTNKGEYDPEWDISAPVIQFDAGKLENIEHPGMFGSAPDQKIKIKNLIAGGQDDNGRQRSILYKDKFPNKVTYFHLPSNNMAWAEEAIARYFGQSRPDFHATRRKLQKQDKTETALLLKESHWRGQLHGEKTAANSRFMRPFCEAISSSPSKVEHNPKNVVVFMPFLHWETSRQRERFSQEIDRLIFSEKDGLQKQELREKEERQTYREGLAKCSLGNSNRSGPSSGSSSAETTTPTPEKDRQQGSRLAKSNSTTPETDLGPLGRQAYSRGLRHLYATGKTLTLETAVQMLDKKGLYPKMDQNRRLTITHKLGQYLMDAARLFEGMSAYRDKKLLEKFLCHDPPLHPRRTLDQAYYWTLDTSRTRDRDQVIYRATTTPFGKFHTFHPEKGWEGHEQLDNRTCSECRDNIRRVSRVVMVDQLWMWILDERTIITCFPKRYGANKNDVSGVHKSIRLRIGQGRPDQVKSVFDLALIIIDECSNTFFDRTRVSHDGYHRSAHSKQPRVLESFSEAIGNISYQQTVAFGRLWRWTERARKIYRNSSDGNASELQVPLLDINPEGELEKEIKDIIEELGIMIYVQKTHRDVLKSLIINVEHILDPTGYQGLRYSRGSSGADTASTLPSQTVGQEQSLDNCDTYDWFRINAEELTVKVNDRIEQLEELQRSAENTATSVKDLLDLKQQQAGVVQAWQSVRQSEETIKQGRSIMIFTVVTIIFLPLSFMSSVFGMNAYEDEENKTSLKQAFKWIFSISFSFLAFTLFVSLSTWARAAIWHYCMRITTTVCVWTGLYRLSLNYFPPSKKLYEDAIMITTKLKEKAKEETFKERIARKDEKRKKEAEKEAEDKKDDYHQKHPYGGVQESSSGGVATSTGTHRSRKWWNGTGNGYHADSAEPVPPV